MTVERNIPHKEWTHGAVPLARGEIHDKVVEIMDKEPRRKVLVKGEKGRLSSGGYAFSRADHGGNTLILVGEKQEMEEG